MSNLKTIALASAVMMTAGAASALELEGSVGVTSDNVFRGVSISNEDAAGKASIQASTKSGWYGGIGVSQIDDGEDEGVVAAASVGWGSDFVTDNKRSFNYGVGVTHYHFTNDVFIYSGDDFTELNLRAGTNLLDGELSANINYSHDIGDDYSGNAMEYVDASLTYSRVMPSLADIELHASIGGSEISSHAEDVNITYANLGASKTYKNFTLGIDYYDSDMNEEETDQRIVGTLSYNF